MRSTRAPIAFAVLLVALITLLPTLVDRTSPLRPSGQADETPTAFVVNPTAGTPDIDAMDTAVAEGDWDRYDMLVQEANAYMDQHDTDTFGTFEYGSPSESMSPDMDAVEAGMLGDVGARRTAAESLAEVNAHAGGYRALSAVVAGLGDVDPRVQRSSAGSAWLAVMRESTATEVAPTPVSHALGDHSWRGDADLALALVKVIEQGDDETAYPAVTAAGRMTVSAERLEGVLIQRYERTDHDVLRAAIVSTLELKGFDSTAARALLGAITPPDRP